MKTYSVLNQSQVRDLFWQTFQQFSRAKHERSPNGHCDTRCAFVDFVDSLARSGQISEALAQRVTL